MERPKQTKHGVPANTLGAPERSFAAVVMGGSIGGTAALQTILDVLPADYGLPLIVVQHLHRTDGGRFAAHLCRHSKMEVGEALDKQPIAAGRIYVAPADYHLLVERTAHLALSVDPRVNWARPSIDVLFESAARVWTNRLVGVILSGANKDGAAGMALIGRLGGLCVAQDPQSAENPVMVQAAIEQAAIAHVLPPAEIARLLLRLGGKETSAQDSGTDDRGPQREKSPLRSSKPEAAVTQIDQNRRFDGKR
jgi:two-component system chemotaxis response regulator CheB